MQKPEIKTKSIKDPGERVHACMSVLVFIKESEVCPHETMICGPERWREHDLIHIPPPTLFLDSTMQASI